VKTENLKFIVPKEISINIKMTLCALSLDRQIIGYIDGDYNTTILLNKDVTKDSEYVKNIASVISTIIDYTIN
tara:strand:- start:4817 stop:5035 length:219 start_codon:yes stop_codon:yes gene_type:complete